MCILFRYVFSKCGWKYKSNDFRFEACCSKYVYSYTMQLQVLLFFWTIFPALIHLWGFVDCVEPLWGHAWHCNFSIRGLFFLPSHTCRKENIFQLNAFVRMGRHANILTLMLKHKNVSFIYGWYKKIVFLLLNSRSVDFCITFLYGNFVNNLLESCCS